MTMNAKMKTVVLSAAAAMLLSAGAASAAPGKHHNNNNWGKPGPSKVFKKGIGPRERVIIARSAADVATVKRRALRDGRVTPVERFQINRAERRHAALIARLYRS
jgi:hypothetical protein